MIQLTKVFILCLAAWQVTALAGGRNAVVGEFPSFVGIVLPISSQICGASIFNRNHVLTAANCMLSNNNLLLSPNQLSIIHGSLTINFNLPRIGVQAIYVHPQYNPFTFENDVAVVRTTSDFIFPQVAVPIVAPAFVSERIGKSFPETSMQVKLC
jgi:trypsin